LKESRAARDEAEAANRAKDEFLAVVSHELRTPLTPILGWVELLRSAGEDEGLRHQAYDVIERNARAQAQIVNDILDVSRITTGKLRLTLKTEALAPLVAAAIDAQQPAARAKGVELKSRLQEVGALQADSGRIQQLVWNLLQNAIKFTPESGHILVQLEREGDEAVLTVQDDGIGVPVDFLPHIFDQFRQADSSSSRPAGGLGLGLAIVRHIAELHGGRVAARSAGENQGATFTVVLPLNAGSATDGEPPAPAPRPEASLSGVSLLLVDDDEDTRLTLARLLESAGATVRSLGSGEEALHLLQSRQPQLVLCDLGMKGMDGYEVCRRLRREHGQLPLIALTAYGGAAARQAAMEAGYDAFLTKPVDLGVLVTTINRELHRERPAGTNC
jgi:CheY-like chemotaxis protein